MNEPENNYYDIGLRPSASEGCHVDVTICKRCGNLVGNIFAHDLWHDGKREKVNGGMMELSELLKADYSLVETVVIPIFGKPFTEHGDYEPTKRECWFGKKK